MQTHFASDGYEKLGGVQRYFADNVRDDYAAGTLDAQVSALFYSVTGLYWRLHLNWQVEGCLQEMRELSIVGLNA